MPATHLEVWGDPIDHSLSPVLHGAAYRALGWDWTYGRRRVDAAAFPAELAGTAGVLRGLSLTMPLKTAAFAAAVRRDRRAELTGAVNTLLLTDEAPRGFNTDVGGLVRALREEGAAGTDAARIVGAGATATSALVALGELGVRHVELAVRRPPAAEPLAQLAARLGVAARVVPLAAAGAPGIPLTIATLPGGARVGADVAASLAAAGGLLFDVVYGHWPTALAAAWERAGGRAVDGGGMLLHQAVLQIRIFASGDPDAPLPGEPEMVAAMRRALVGG